MTASDDTICAIATAPGGAIGIVRVSGPRAIEIADSIFSGSLTDVPGHSMRYGRVDGVDEVLASVFRAPHSYTGEDSVELSCHGSQFILSEVCRLLIAHGCRQAEPGEFTQRAFLNGKLDLAQAEAVADLIASRTQAQHRMAISQLRGTFSRHIDSLHDRLLHLTTLMELELDFADHEELEFADRSELNALTDEILDTIGCLADSFATGNAIKEGVRVAIVGPTNAGKSTLLNSILHEERAIVSDIHGTTRDTIEDTFVWQGITFRFIDTAGLRETTDEVERIGIDRTHAAIQNAHIVLYLSDKLSDLECADKVEGIAPSKTIRILTKIDRNEKDNYQLSIINCQFESILPISAKTGEGLEAMQQRVCDMAREQLHIDSTDLIVNNLRHYEALREARTALQRVREALGMGVPTDLVTQDLREAIHHLATITHREITPDAVLHNVFRNFCVGK